MVSTPSDVSSPSGPEFRALFLTHNYPRFGGDFAGSFVQRLTRAVAGQGISVRVVAPHHPGAAESERDGAIAMERFRYGSDEAETIAYGGELNRLKATDFAQVRRLWRFWRSYRDAGRRWAATWHPHVIHAHWWIPGGMVARRAARGNTPYIVTAHGTDVRMLVEGQGMGGGVLRRLARRVFGDAARATVVSTALKGQLCELFPQVENRIVVLPMPADENVFGIAEGQMPGRKADNSAGVGRILTVTRFTEQKRVGDFVDALALLYRQGVNFTAEIVGEGPLENAIKSRVAEAGLAETVTISQPIAAVELAERYRAADVCVLNSEAEGFGMVLVEAQLCGTAVIGTASGGILDIIEDGDNGLLVPVRSPESLADVIAVLLRDPDRRRRLAAAGAESALRFTTSRIAGEFAAIYRDVAARSAGVVV